MSRHIINVEDFTEDDLVVTKTLASAYGRCNNKKLEIVYYKNSYTYQVTNKGKVESITSSLDWAIDSYNSF